MRTYEKVAMITILSTILFTLLDLPMFLLLILAAIAIVITTFIDKRFLILLPFFTPPILYPVLNHTTPLKLGRSYKLTVNIVDDRVEVAKVGLKSLADRYYIDKEGFEGLEGKYIVEYTPYTIKEYKNSFGLEGDRGVVRESWSNYITRSIKTKVEASRYSVDLESFAKGVLIGDRSSISEDLSSVFRKSGASHLLAISGLHIGLVVAFILYPLSLLPVSYKWRYSIALFFLTFYVLILGYSPSIQRAYIMAFIYLLAKIFLDKSESKKSLCIALVISLNINMLLIGNIAFQMSYMALFAILYLYNKGENTYINLFKLSFLIQLALSPIFAYYFHNLPVLQFLSNIVVVAVGSLLILLLYFNLILNYLGLDLILLYPIQLLFDMLLVFIEVVATMKFGAIELFRLIPSYIYYISIIGILSYPFVKFNKYYYSSLLILVVFYPLLPYREIKGAGYTVLAQDKVLLISETYGRSEVEELIERYRVDSLFGRRLYSIGNIHEFKVEEGDRYILDHYIVYNTNGDISYIEK